MRSTRWFLPALTILALIPLAAYAQTRVVVKEIISITVDKAQVRTDVPPINVRGQTLVPIRGVFEALSAYIDWFPETKQALVQDDRTTIKLTIGESLARVNGNPVRLSVPATIYRGRTMVPLRFIAEALGATVSWDPETQTITILSRSQATPVESGRPPTARPSPSPSAEPTPADEPSTAPPDSLDDGE